MSIASVSPLVYAHDMDNDEIEMMLEDLWIDPREEEWRWEGE